MADPTLVEQIEAAETYEGLYVPALFEQFAIKMIDGAKVETGDRLLDVACGTGVLARYALERVGPSGSVVGLDPGPGMLAVAKRLAPSVDWREGTAESLRFPDGSFDKVMSAFGLMFFTDRAGALREMTRVLAPGGTLTLSTWESLERSEVYPEAVELLERLAGTKAADALRAPFVLGNTEELASLLEGAGLDSVQIETHTGTARFPSVRTLLEADLRGWLPVMGVLLDEETIEQILEEAESVLAEYVTDDGRAVFHAPAHIVTGTRRLEDLESTDTRARARS